MIIFNMDLTGNQVCVVEVACHFCLEGAAPRGPPWHFLGAQAAILLLVCGVAIMVQERALNPKP